MAGGTRVVRKKNTHKPMAEDAPTMPNAKLGDMAPEVNGGVGEPAFTAAAKEHNKSIPALQKAQMPSVEKHTNMAPNLSATGHLTQPRGN
eukprot:627506-Rhodomonas_salina.1